MSSKAGYLPSYRLREAEMNNEQWPERPVSNQNHTDAAIVIIGGG